MKRREFIKRAGAAVAAVVAAAVTPSSVASARAFNFDRRTGVVTFDKAPAKGEIFGYEFEYGMELDGTLTTHVRHLPLRDSAAQHASARSTAQDWY